MAVTSQIDWLTLTCLTSKDIHVIDFLERLLRTLYLDKLWDNGDFIHVGRDKHYSCVYRYNDISICLCRDTPEQLIKQGICISFSSNGLAFYQEYLEQNFEEIDLRTVCLRWRSLCCDGFFTRCSRFDYAMDDKCTDSEEPLLTMRRVRQSLKRREFTSLLSCERSPESNKIPVCFDSSKKISELVGDTVYLGKRKGGSVVIRFYDKFLEQKARKSSLDDITSWVRCEFEFHNDRSMAAFNAFCVMETDEFKNYMSEVFNHYISFIYRDDVNVSRCTIKRWWKNFLDTAKKSKLISPPYKAATFVGTQKWLEKSVFPTLAQYIKCIGFHRFLKKLAEFINKPATPRINQMVEDYKTIEKFGLKQFIHNNVNYDDYIKSRGFDPWLLTGSVTADELKADYCSFSDFSPSALQFDGEQLDLLCEGLI